MATNPTTGSSEFDVIDEIYVPRDPMDDLECDSCQ